MLDARALGYLLLLWHEVRWRGRGGNGISHEVQMQKKRAASRYELNFIVPF